MSWWSIAVYSVAALVALRTLFALMAQHRSRHWNHLVERNTEPREVEQASEKEAGPRHERQAA